MQVQNKFFMLRAILLAPAWLCVFAVSGGMASAQVQLLKNYSVKDGLASTEVYNVFQDSKGYMWFATDAGVSRFDGYSFKNFNTSDGLPDNTIFELYEDHRNRIWFRSYTGKLSYYKDGKITRLPVNDQLAELMRNNVSMTIAVDKGDTLWLGLYIGLMVKIALNSGPMQVEVTRLDSNYMHVIELSGGEHLVSSCSCLNIKFIGRGKIVTGKLLPYRADKYIAPAKSVKKKNGDYVVSFEDYLAAVNEDTIVFHDRKHSLMAVDIDKENNIWAGYLDRGVDMYLDGDLTSEPIRFLDNYSVTSVFQDHEGGYWFSTRTHGVFYMSTRHIRNYATYGLSRANSLVIHNDSTLLVGLESGKIQVYNTRNETYSVADPGLNNVRQIIPDKPGYYWILGALYIKYLDWKKQQSITYPLDGFRNGLRESDSTLLLSAAGGGVRRFNKYKSSVKPIPIADFDQQVYTLASFGNQLWIGSLAGLLRYDGKNIYDLGKTHPKLANRFSAIIEPFPGQLWMSSIGGGIIIFEPGTGIVKELTPRQDLAHEICRFLFHDQNGNVWAATNGGVSQIQYSADGKQLRVSNFDQSSGLLSNEVRKLIRHQNKLWLATTDGITVIDIDQFKPSQQPPPVYITGVSVHNRPVPVQGQYDLPHMSNNITIDYVGLSYRNPGKVRYKLKMVGIDTAWRYTSQPQIQYSILPPGDYTFMIYALNENNVPSVQPAELRFSIAAPYWQQSWFRLSIALAVLCFLIFILNLRHHNQQRINRERIKSTEMELTALRAQMNPHFIFNALASIQHFILGKDMHEAHRYLGKFSKLIRNVLTNSRKELISISDELKTIEPYLDLEQLRSSNKFTYRIEIDDSIDPDKVEVPTMLIQPFAENAIWHGLIPAEHEGRLLIALRHEKERGLLRTIIEDNGIGRVRSQANRENTRKEHTSLGIQVTRQRLSTLKTKYGFEIDLQITDLYHPDGEGAGTRVEITLPFLLNTTT